MFYYIGYVARKLLSHIDKYNNLYYDVAIIKHIKDIETVVALLSVVT